MAESDDDVRLMIERNSPYLTADDLLDQDATVTIVSVKSGTVEDPKSRKKTRKAIVSLKGWEKPWACNITNARTVASIVGGFSAKLWVGKRVTIYPAQNIRKPDGTSGPAIRVRPDKPTAAGIPQSALRGAPTGSISRIPDAPDTRHNIHPGESREPGEDDV